MAQRTYIPGLTKRIRELNRYVKRYDEQLDENMTTEQKGALDGALAYMPTLLELFPEDPE